MGYIGNGPNLVQFSRDLFTGNASTTSFSLSFNPGGANGILVEINGVYQTPTLNYTVSGQTLTFTSAPPNGAVISIVYLGTAGTIGSNINGVVYPSSPSTGTVPVVTNTNTVSYVSGVPSIAVLTSGTLYTTPTSGGNLPLYLKVRMVGGGGGGGGGNNSIPGASGSATTFGTLTANGGTGGAEIGAGEGTGGSASGGNIINATGQSGVLGTQGQTGVTNGIGQNGGSTVFGAGGTGTFNGTATSASTNSGGGGGGGFANASPFNGGNGGGAGGYVESIITSPSATYSYSVGTGGAGASGGSGGSTGGNGAAGIITVEAYFV
jgi:hypothetical protein